MAELMLFSLIPQKHLHNATWLLPVDTCPLSFCCKRRVCIQGSPQSLRTTFHCFEVSLTELGYVAMARGTCFGAQRDGGGHPSRQYSVLVQVTLWPTRDGRDKFCHRHVFRKQQPHFLAVQGSHLSCLRGDGLQGCHCWATADVCTLLPCCPVQHLPCTGISLYAVRRSPPPPRPPPPPPPPSRGETLGYHHS